MKSEQPRFGKPTVALETFWRRLAQDSKQFERNSLEAGRGYCVARSESAAYFGNMGAKREIRMLIGKNNFRVTAFATASLLLTGWCGTARAQSQGDSGPSVAEAARKARESKKENAKPARTFTNDDLPKGPAGDVANGAVSPTPAANGDEAATPMANEGGEKKPAAAANDEQAKQKKTGNAAALERAKKQLATALSELDIMQRKLALDSDSYYSKTDYASDKDGKANLDAEAQEINEKKQAVEELKARVTELQALVGEPAENESDQPDKSDKNPPSR
jgi:hypothetical protein